MWASGQPTGEGEEVDLLSFMGLNERRHRQDRHVISEIFIFFIYIHGIQYIYKMFLLKIMGIQMNTLELRWARPCSLALLQKWLACTIIIRFVLISKLSPPVLTSGPTGILLTEGAEKSRRVF